MTKFILHGGATKKTVPGNQQFFREIISGFNGKVKLLLIYFARKNEEWPRLLADDQKNFQRDLIGGEINLELADADPVIFEKQLEKTDAIYVRGGDTEQLLEKIKTVSNFSELIKNKIYAGSSAGAYLVAKYYYSNEKNGIGEGLGILPIKVFAHWSNDQKEALAKLKSVGGDLPIYKIPETEYVVLEG